MKVSRTVAYALRATLQLAECNSRGPIPCSRLASDGDMPERFLLQILRSLVTEGILQSTRGVDGGYALGRPPEMISVLEVIEAIEGPLTSSFPESAACDSLPGRGQERLRMALESITCSVRQQLDAIKFSQLTSASSAEPAL